MDLVNSPIVKGGSPGLTESGSSPPEGNSPSPHPTPTRAPLVQATLARFTTNIPPAAQRPASSAPKTQPASPAPKTQPDTMAKHPASASTSEPPAKRKKLSPEEKAAREAAEEAKRKEREQKKKEKEEADKLKAELKAAKEAEKAAKDAEKQKKLEEKEAEKRKKEEEKRKKEEEEAKKARSQKKLTSMFNITPAAKKDKKPEKDQKNGPADEAGGAPKEESAYKATFKPFYVKDNVKMAETLFVDPETCIAKTKILEEWIEGKRGELERGPFNPREACQLIRAPIHRGRVYPKVGKIMAEYHSQSLSGAPISESQIRHTREALKSVPVKSLKFREDVRPPYIGTISGLPAGVKSLNKIARNPIRKDILPLNYDYDSEAEWQDDDGEDVDDLDDSEEDLDDDEGMDDFLDDSEDSGPARQLFSGGMEPESTGLCWETPTHVSPAESLEQYRLELWPEHLENFASVDPWIGGDIYWPKKDKEKKGRDRDGNEATTAGAQTQSGPASGANATSTSPNSMAPPPVPSDAFQTLTGKSTDKKPVQKLPAEDLDALKELLRSKPNLSKVGIVEVFAANHTKKFPKVQIKAAVEELTEKVGKGWKLKEP
ncbi:chromatin assembly factor 1 subunit rlf2 [Naviculisporaceae sp. PSN 640]